MQRFVCRYVGLVIENELLVLYKRKWYAIKAWTPLFTEDTLPKFSENPTLSKYILDKSLLEHWMNKYPNMSYD